MKKLVGLYKLTTFIGIIVVLSALFFYNNYNYNLNKTNSTVYVKIIENIFRDNSKYIQGSVALWGKGDVRSNQIYMPHGNRGNVS